MMTRRPLSTMCKPRQEIACRQYSGLSSRCHRRARGGMWPEQKLAVKGPPRRPSLRSSQSSRPLRRYLPRYLYDYSSRKKLPPSLSRGRHRVPRAIGGRQSSATQLGFSVAPPVVLRSITWIPWRAATILEPAAFRAAIFGARCEGRT